VRCENHVYETGANPLLRIIDHTSRCPAQRQTGLDRQRIELHTLFLEPGSRGCLGFVLGIF
jgi:hypothetical protein